MNIRRVNIRRVNIRRVNIRRVNIRRVNAPLTLIVASRCSAKVAFHVPLPGTPLRDEPPGAIAETPRVAFHRLAARGELYGQRQAGTAGDLAAIRRRRRQPRSTT